jgi:Terminase large subunit, T4likevirus-type, N-terminal
LAALNLSLHINQLKVFNDPAQVRVICAGRGFGKSVLMLLTAILFCIGYKGKINPMSPQVALIAMPTLKMAKRIHWLPLLNLLQVLPVVENINKSDYTITFKGDRPDLIIRGADLQGDRLRGLNIVFCGLDEYQDFDATIWDEILDAALARNKNWRALIIGTPKGKTTHFYKFCQRAIKNRQWSYYHFVTADNPFISRKELRRAERELPAKVFRQEYRASWEDFDGQLFPNLSEAAKASTIPTEFRAVYVGADWGDINPHMTVVGVTHDGLYYLIDQFGTDGTTPITADEIEQKAAEFEREYSIFRFYLPDDRPASILAFRRYGKKHKLSGMRRSIQVARNKPGPAERALIGNSLLYQKRLFFGPRCHGMYDDWVSYHRAKDRAGNLLSEPAKGQSNHSIDSTLHVIGQLEGKYVMKGGKAA